MTEPGVFDRSRLARIQALENHHFWFVARRRLVTCLLDPIIAASATRPISLLDVGCGTGSLALALSSAGLTVLAADLNIPGLERIARERRGRLLAILANAEQIPAIDSTFDAAIALDVLEHADDRRVLGEIARVLKPGGRVVLTVPAFRFLWSSRDEDAGHHRRYSRADVRQLLRQASLDLVEMRFYQCLLLPVVVATRWWGRRSRASQRVEEQPSPWVNRLCLAINDFEVAVGGVIPWPWGSSLAVVARKPQ